MTERRRYLVLDSFVPREPEHKFVQPGRCCEGRVASDILPTATPWVRLAHPRASRSDGRSSYGYIGEHGDSPIVE